LEEAIDTLGAVLSDRGLRYELVVVGGGSLMLLGLLDRPTKDIDIVALVRERRYQSAEPLPQPLEEAVKDVASTLGLIDTWLNAGPTALLDFGLPEGFHYRVETRNYGGLRLHVAGRLDQIHLKLYAAIDQGPQSKHFADLRLLEPTPEELLISAQWARTHDPSPAFKNELEAALQALGVQNAKL
jgi:hypothetical protein